MIFSYNLHTILELLKQLAWLKKKKTTSKEHTTQNSACVTDNYAE
jgi:hypothetical protein